MADLTDTEMLERMFKLFTYSNFDRRGESQQSALQFLFKEGVGIWDIDAELELALIERFKKNPTIGQ